MLGKVVRPIDGRKVWAAGVSGKEIGDRRDFKTKGNWQQDNWKDVLDQALAYIEVDSGYKGHLASGPTL